MTSNPDFSFIDVPPGFLSVLSLLQELGIIIEVVVEARVGNIHASVWISEEHKEAGTKLVRAIFDCL